MNRKLKITAFIPYMTLFGMLMSCHSAIGQTPGGNNDLKEDAGAMPAPSKVVFLMNPEKALTINVGDKLRYVADVHRSTGNDVWIDYDMEAFRAESQVEYANPEMSIPMEPGSDAAEETYTYTALKKGTFTFKITEVETGPDGKNVTTYTINVE